ncbi:thioredoxin domain-containing protein [Devosia sp.]|uniref:DsbA family protein n=1 Tax=Devosia sp. TaxID=1871048 RepID=UPI001B2D4127|nr:thioredoxin domain-containing protein [Devosia sp.]MBO9588799.1 thioredoxin domain-containing protein [Devosia sp.]
MNRRLLLIAAAIVALGAFALAAFLYPRLNSPQPVATIENSNLVRFDSIVIGEQNAPVTIVEWFDPSCEACRAFYPIVKQIMDRYPGKVRLVLRYAPLHEGSDEAVRILEAARKQNLFIPVLETLLMTQPTWAAHGAPDLDRAWQAAGSAGLDSEKGRMDAAGGDISARLEQEKSDLEALGISQTPTFYVNGQELIDFGPQQLADLVAEAVSKSN